MRVEFPIVSFVCAALVLAPLPWHWRARNVSTLSVIFWLATCNIIQGVNSIIWGGNVIVKYQVWCDITTKLYIGANIGLPASVLCICRYLAQISSPRHAILNGENKQQRMKFEIGMCAVVPTVVMALHYVVQGHRYDIVEDIGCRPATYISVVALLIVYLPPVVFSLLGLVYAGVALRWLVHRCTWIQAILQPSQSNPTAGRYLRLIALSIVEMLFSTAITLFLLIITIANGLRPWYSWEFVHSDWMHVGQFVKELLPEYSWDLYMFFWYVIPVTSVIFFAFFGFGKETTTEYRDLLYWIRVRVFGIRSERTPVLPVAARDAIPTSHSAMDNPIVGLGVDGALYGVGKSGAALHSIYTVSQHAAPLRDGHESALELGIRSTTPSGSHISPLPLNSPVCPQV